MRTSDSGSGTRAAALGIALLAGTVAALAQITPYDFSGHWTGGAIDKKGNSATLAADFSAGTKPNTFTGMFSATVQGGTIQCTAHGRQKPNEKVKILLGLLPPVRGALDRPPLDGRGKHAREGIRF